MIENKKINLLSGVLIITIIVLLCVTAYLAFEKINENKNNNIIDNNFFMEMTTWENNSKFSLRIQKIERKSIINVQIWLAEKIIATYN